MATPTIHIHEWALSDRKLLADKELEHTGTYDDHLQFSGRVRNKQVEIRVMFKDLSELIKAKELYEQENEG